MERWRAVLKKLLFPGRGWAALAVLLGGISLALTFLVFGDGSPFAYESFGWVLDERAQENSSAGKGMLLLKRERKIVNKAELTRLQRHFESCMDEIRALESSKTSSATIWAIAAGLAGTAFMAGPPLPPPMRRPCICCARFWPSPVLSAGHCLTFSIKGWPPNAPRRWRSWSSRNATKFTRHAGRETSCWAESRQYS